MVRAPPPIFVTIKERLSGLPPKAIVPNYIDVVETWVWGPSPNNEMVCVDGLSFRALSVSVTVPACRPSASGVKLMLMLHRPPGAREELAVQSAGVPESGTKVKLLLTLSPFRASVALPMF
jgi:hypothetical protein